MATTHSALPPQQAFVNPGHMSIYGHPSPSNSTANTPANSSPTSPQMSSAGLVYPSQSRQIRPPKAPLYVPAVLRPTERPSKSSSSKDSSPITPPRSVHGSLDSLNEDPAPVARQTTFHSIKAASDEAIKSEFLGEVTGVPTRDHWKADAAAHTCDSPTCRSSFGIFTRRHHCRHCGHVFCASHTPYMVPLDQDARFHPEGSASRACDQCFKAYHRWEETRAARIQQKLDERESLSDSGEVEHDEQTPETAQRQPEFTIATSVPRGWNWSTF
ncbi:uncharacterized protein TRUGW13939_08729 [Talaromyces rugulosus]|uniref:FYVE-type domain-containing protein n=1 Tax=Talaromyces rugulosus TaxID=121627 RepID=A0A7H8R5V4_TALRU|nr:uncharacterized protein TRUGW13939_08729 [Talaromyces rugulosus]QKX61577.1 hypothetical protein TRUGW13939_08729 [Talaromyces rugulosus]